MWTFYGIVLVGIWTVTSVWVSGIQVPNIWKRGLVGNGYEASGQSYIYPSTNQQLKYEQGVSPSKNIQYAPLSPLAVGRLYVGATTKSSALNHNDLSHNINTQNIGQSVLPRYLKQVKGQEALPSANTPLDTQQDTVPSLRSPRYPTGQDTKNLYHNSDYISPNRLKYLESLNGNDYKKYQNLPNNVLKIKPTAEIPVSYDNQFKESEIKKPLTQFAKVFNPEVFKTHPQPTLSSLYNLYLPNAGSQPSLKHALNHHVPQQHKFIVSASEADSNHSPLDLEVDSNFKAKESTTSKEPVFFVTEGYRNVLIQGPNKKKTYMEPQIQKKGSNKIFREHKPEEDNEDDTEEEDEEETPPRQRKVTKVYRIKGGKPNEDPAGGFSKNSLKSYWEKPTTFYDRPLKYFNEDRKSRLSDQLSINYRDDTLHEPENDADFHREDDDDEKLTDDDDDDENEDENIDEENKENKIKEDLAILRKPEIEVNKETRQENIKSSPSETTDEEVETDEEENDEESDTEEGNDEVAPEEDKELKLLDNEHAEPKPIPTKPIYPGQGLWAKPGLKHTPHVTQHRFLKPIEGEQKPDGYDVFENLENFFQKQKVNHGNGLNQNAPVATTLNFQAPPHPGPALRLPNPPKPLIVYDPFNEGSRRISHRTQQPFFQHEPASNQLPYHFESSRQTPKGQETGDSVSEFVPSRLYAQVRKSENVAHEPRDPAKHGRLKEVIKDSKVQTVYSEEGYEDAAYDHAGHEKNAEEDKEYSQFQKAKQGKGDLGQLLGKKHDTELGASRKQVVVSDPPKGVLLDSLTSDSEYPSPEKYIEQINDKMANLNNETIKSENVNNFISTKETKTTQVKDKDNGDLQLEIESEVKVITQPNNSTKAHKFVKIYPKVLKEISVESYKDEEDDIDNDDDEDGINVEHDGYDNDGNFNNYFTSDKRGNLPESYKKIEDKYFTSTEDPNILNNAAADLKSGELSNKVNSSNPENASTNANQVTEIFDKILASTTESSTVSDIEAMTKESVLNGLNRARDTSKVGSESIENAREINLARKKRSSESFEDVEIDTDFIDKINHTFAPAVKEKLDLVKYPYYRMPGVNKDSPLRYAETTKNIPLKRAGELSFYKMADQFECPDLPEDVDPIPDGVQNAKTNEDIEELEEDEDDDESVVDKKQPKKLRIELGDKIDCLKLRYFGENPLDNPIFKESAISPVRPIFKEQDRKPRQMMNNKLPDNAFNPSEVYEQINEIFNYKNEDDDEFGSGLNDKFFSFINTPTIETVEVRSKYQNKVLPTENVNEASIRSNSKLLQPITLEAAESTTTPNSLISLITTPKYTIQLTPNNIYDQIKLLDHLPGDEEYVTGKVEYTTAATALDRIDEPEESISPNIEIVQTAEKSDKNRKSKQRDPRELNKKEDSVTVSSINIGREAANVIEPEAWRRQRVGNRRPPLFQIFDVTKFLTTTPFSVINTASTTVLPKHKVMSEVFYKEEIKPSEQLTVFADILNNIKNSTNNGKVSMQSSSNFAEPSAVTISSLPEPPVARTRVPERTKLRVKKFQTDSSNKQNALSGSRQQHKSSTRRPYRERMTNNIQSSSNQQLNIAKRPFVPRENQHNFDYDLPNYSSQSDEPIFQTAIRPETKIGTKKVLKRRRKPTTTTTTSTTITPEVHSLDQNLAANHKPYVIDYIEDVEQVIGLVPPQNSKYRTIIFDDSEVGGSNTVADQIYDYEAVVPKVARGPTTVKQPAPVTEVFEEVSTPRQLNKYYFLGLKPPTTQRAMSYSEFTNNNLLVNDNLLRRRVAHVGYLRDKRNVARPSYADLSRNRGRQTEVVEKDASNDDADDYIPHRPRNYHYDEKTGKIVYHSKPAQDESEEDEEDEYEEIKDTSGVYLERAEGATHPTKEKVTTKPLLATATPPPEGKGLLDFVVQLKNDKSYVYIPDPTTPKSGSKLTTAAPVTVDPKTTDPPEFLNILSKVKSDKTYKFVEDPKESESKQKNVSTTPQSESSESDGDDEDGNDESEEESAGQNHSRPTRQITNLQIFNIGDFLPKIQTPISSQIPTNFFKKQVVERIIPRLQYMTPHDIAREYYEQTELYKYVKKLAKKYPRKQSLADLQIFDIGEYLPTLRPIDYSKYKTIERPRTRFQPEEEALSEATVVTRRPSSGPGGEPVTADRRKLSIEEKESADAPVVSAEKVAHDAKVAVSRQNSPGSTTTRRTVQLRRGTRPSTKRTKDENQILDLKEPTTTRRTFNRYRPASPRSTRRTTTIANFEHATEDLSKSYPDTERDYSANNDKARRVYRRRPVRIRSTTQRQKVANDDDNDDDDDDDEIDHKRVRRSVDLSLTQSQSERLEKPIFGATYQSIKNGVVNGNDKTDFPAYEFEDEQGSESKSDIIRIKPTNVVILNKNFDKEQKHGGNYRRENDNVDEAASDIIDDRDNPESKSLNSDLKKVESVTSNKKQEVDIVNANYDKTKKHGGNYKNLKDIQEDVSQQKESQEDVQSITDNYEKTKLRAGNFKSRGLRNENQEDATKPATKSDNVQIINNNYDKTKKHGGNYRESNDNDYEDDAVAAADITREHGEDVVKDIEAKPDKQVDGEKKLDVAVTYPNLDSNNNKSDEDSITDELLESQENSQSQGNSDFSVLDDEVEPTQDPFEENSRRRFYIRPKTTTTTSLPKTISRLSDVIPKPDHFYSDSQLPAQINKLGSEKVPVKLASEELDQLAVEGDVVEEIHRPQRRGAEIRRSYFDDHYNPRQSRDSKFSEKLRTSTKKPLFEKDPSKRLYFYVSD